MQTRSKIEDRMRDIAVQVTQKAHLTDGGITALARKLRYRPHSLTCFLYKCRTNPMGTDISLKRLIKVATKASVRVENDLVNVNSLLGKHYEQAIKTLKIWMIQNDHTASSFARKIKKTRAYVSMHLVKSSYKSRTEKELFIKNISTVVPGVNGR